MDVLFLLKRYGVAQCAYICMYACACNACSCMRVRGAWCVLCFFRRMYARACACACAFFVFFTSHDSVVCFIVFLPPTHPDVSVCLVCLPGIFFYDRNVRDGHILEMRRTSFPWVHEASLGLLRRVNTLGYSVYTLGVSENLPILLWGYPSTHQNYSGGTRVSTETTLGVPEYLPKLLWGYPSTCQYYSGGTRVPTKTTLVVPEYLPKPLWGYPSISQNYAGGTRVPANTTLGVPEYLPKLLRGYPST